MTNTLNLNDADTNGPITSIASTSFPTSNRPFANSVLWVLSNFTIDESLPQDGDNVNNNTILGTLMPAPSQNPPQAPAAFPPTEQWAGQAGATNALPHAGEVTDYAGYHKLAIEESIEKA